MRIKWLSPIVEQCRICKRDIPKGNGDPNNPIERVTGLCGNCTFRTLKMVLNFNCNIIRNDYFV